MNSPFDPVLVPDIGNAEQQLSRRASVAVALAPIGVLLALMLLIADLIGADVALMVFVGCVAWLVAEMHRYQSAIARRDDALFAPAEGLINGS